MIIRAVKSQSAAGKAAGGFLEWASLFSAEIFVKLILYADESGTHESRLTIIAGIAAPIEEWAKLCSEWKAVLNKYQTTYFHFREWSDASCVVRGKRKASTQFLRKNPYRNWSLETLDRFLLELAKIAGSGNKLFVWSGVDKKVMEDAKASGQVSVDVSYQEHCVRTFFNRSIQTAIKTQRPPWKGKPIAFFFDQTDDHKWSGPIVAEFQAAKKKNPSFKELAFADKKDMPHLPLQAADMAAYRARQFWENWIDEDYQRIWEELDAALFKAVYDVYRIKIGGYSQTMLKDFILRGNMFQLRCL